MLYFITLIWTCAAMNVRDTHKLQEETFQKSGILIFFNFSKSSSIVIVNVPILTILNLWLLNIPMSSLFTLDKIGTPLFKITAFERSS